MIKKIAWNAFKNTGDINTFLELKQIEDIEKEIQGIENNPLEETKININKEIEKNQKNDNIL